MLPEFDKNAAFIWACYSVGVILIGVTLLLVLWRERTARSRLEQMETQKKDETSA